ncbi:MAG: hypothetical protein WCT33_03700 [Patescibacteria group bacterium]
MSMVWVIKKGGKKQSKNSFFTAVVRDHSVVTEHASQPSWSRGIKALHVEHCRYNGK